MRRTLLTCTFALLLAACQSEKAGTTDASGQHMGVVSRDAAPMPANAPASVAVESSVGPTEAKAEMNDAVSESAAPPDASGATQFPSDAQYSDGPTLNPTMIIRTGQASIQVDSLEIALARVRQLAMLVGGYVGNSSMTGGKDELRSATIEIKMPAQNFDRAVSGLAPIGHVESVSTSAEDVGEEYVDIQARVTNAHKLESRLLDLLATRTGKLADVLEVEQQLARVREDIERMEGRMRFLRTRAAVSTLTVSVHEPPPVLNAPGENPIADAFKAAWHNFVGLVAGLIAMLGVIIPLVILGIVAWRLFKHWTSRNGKGGEPPADEMKKAA